MKNYTDYSEIEKSKAHIQIELLEYKPDKAQGRTNNNKRKERITVTLSEAEAVLGERKSRFENFIQIIEGVADVVINKRTYKLRLGEGIVIPADVKYNLHSTKQFRLLSTIINNGNNGL
jgi:mannose-6-phosphate isomerase-like protein (cupin superfamily)